MPIVVARVPGKKVHAIIDVGCAQMLVTTGLVLWNCASTSPEIKMVCIHGQNTTYAQRGLMVHIQGTACSVLLLSYPTQ